MISLRPGDAQHRSQLHRLLMEVADRLELSQHLAFKGGTCAAMLGYLDRFSIDLDFDLLPGAEEAGLRRAFHAVFPDLGLKVKEEFDNALLFQLQYASPPGSRNTLKISVNSHPAKKNRYQVRAFREIDRLLNAQTLETMVANKLVALTDRHRLHGTIAGRDLYDIHHFLVHGYGYLAPVIYERTGQPAKDYLGSLVEFIRGKVTQTMVNEDLNTLLPAKQFQQVRKILIPETILLLQEEIDRQE